ncbi:hypothetical protein EMPS_09036 [Entomortierella parvispora]|uniref:Alpha/beta hydrolase fold-3 domain-containing protein n=1 Tax=Entomortierella parvispora TaxID=205924 RepID=A0A9P3HHG0_9FUNG|nr:hypothetical protein EMPS_09036 [Entomortierella parvispora]
MAVPKIFKYIRVVLHTFVGLIFFILLIIPTMIYAVYLRLRGPNHVPFHSHFFLRIVYLAAAMFPYQWYQPALALRTIMVPGQRSMVVKRDGWTAYWVGTLETKKIPAETRGGSPTWKVSLKGVDMIMLYAHGGGFVFGDAEMYNNIFCSWVEHFKTVHNKNLRILSVDYDLAPQKKFPHQRDQFLSAYRFLVEEIKWNPRKIIFGGDSTGGNITLNATYILREQGLPPPRALLCISPWIRLDADENTSPSMAHNRKTDFLPPQVFKKIARSYAGPKEISDPHVSPFYVQDHSKFPEMAMIYSASEVLRDDAARFVDHYQSSGGRVTYHYMAEGMPHVYPLLRELAGKTAVKDAERRLMEWVNMLVEENKMLFEHRKKMNALAAQKAREEAATKNPFMNRGEKEELPDDDEPIQQRASSSSSSSSAKDLAYASRAPTPQISHATRVIAAQPTMSYRQLQQSQQELELQQVVIETSGRSSPFVGGDKEELRQDDSDDEGEDDDIAVEMLIVNNN